MASPHLISVLLDNQPNPSPLLQLASGSRAKPSSSQTPTYRNPTEKYKPSRPPNRPAFRSHTNRVYNRDCIQRTFAKHPPPAFLLLTDSTQNTNWSPVHVRVAQSPTNQLEPADV